MAGYGDKSDVVASSFLNRAPDQAAYVVHDLRAGLESWAKKMGVPDWVGWDYDGSYLPKRFYAGEPAEYRSLVAIPTYGPKVEIIQPITGPSVFTTYLEDRGPGLHHVGYFVPDMSEVREWFAARGVAEIMSGGGQGGMGPPPCGFVLCPTRLPPPPPPRGGLPQDGPNRGGPRPPGGGVAG